MITINTNEGTSIEKPVTPELGFWKVASNK